MTDIKSTTGPLLSDPLAVEIIRAFGKAVSLKNFAKGEKIEKQLGHVVFTTVIHAGTRIFEIGSEDWKVSLVVYADRDKPGSLVERTVAGSSERMNDDFVWLKLRL